MDKGRQRRIKTRMVNLMWSVIVLMGLLLVMSFASRCSFETGPKKLDRFSDLLPNVQNWFQSLL
jgi:hypothetical protein